MQRTAAIGLKFSARVCYRGFSVRKATGICSTIFSSSKVTAVNMSSGGKPRVYVTRRIPKEGLDLLSKEWVYACYWISASVDRVFFHLRVRVSGSGAAPVGDRPPATTGRPPCQRIAELAVWWWGWLNVELSFVDILLTWLESFDIRHIWSTDCGCLLSLTQLN